MVSTSKLASPKQKTNLSITELTPKQARNGDVSTSKFSALAKSTAGKARGRSDWSEVRRTGRRCDGEEAIKKTSRFGRKPNQT